MRYGHFDDSRREYVITHPDTPLPWINYLGMGIFFGVISNTVVGYSCYRVSGPQLTDVDVQRGSGFHVPHDPPPGRALSCTRRGGGPGGNCHY